MADNKVQGTTNADVLSGTAGRDLIYGYGGNDTMYGGDGNDMIYGGSGNDTMYGGDGDDGLVGGGGGDTMYGGLGNDTYYVNSVLDVVVEYSNEGIDTVVSSLADYRIGANVERLTIAEGAMTDNAGRANGTGNDMDNRLKGSSIGNSFHGMGGNDDIYGYGGDDIINGGTGNDIMDGGDGTDLVTFKDGAALGQGVGGNGGCYVNLNIHSRYDTGYGMDAINNFENIEGTQFADILVGDGNANKILALGGGDQIRGAGGNDDITGGTGADQFMFDSTATNGVDTIRDFQSGTDKLVFRVADGYDAGATLSYNAASGTGAQFIYNTHSQQLYYDADGTGAGAAVLLANLAENPALTLQMTDIVIM